MRLQSTTARKASWMVVPLLFCLGSVAALSNTSAGCGDNLAECPTRLPTADALSPLAILDGGVHADLALLGQDLPRASKVASLSPTPTKHKPKPKPKPKSTEPHKKPSKSTEPHKKPPKSTEPHKKPPPKSKSHASKGHDEPTVSLTPPPKQTHKPKPKPKPHTKPHSSKSHEPSLPHSTEPHHPSHSPAVPPSPSPTIRPESPSPTIADPTGTPVENLPTATGTEAQPTPSLEPSFSPTATVDVGTTAGPSPTFTASPSAGHDPSPSPATVASSEPTPDPEPTPNSEPTHGVQTPPRPTVPPPATTTTTEPAPKGTTAATSTTTAGVAIPTSTAAPSPNSSIHHTRPTKTTPWLPPTIEPVTPPKTIHTAPPGASLPDVVIPDLHPDIPDNSIKVHMRFERVSYYQVINNGILAAQLVSFIPAQLCQLLNVDCGLIMVLAIRDGANASSITSRKLKKRRHDSDMVEAEVSKDQDNVLPRSGGAAHVLVRRETERIALLEKRGLVTTNNVADAILVTVAIPRPQYWSLNALLTNPSSALFTVGATNFGQFLDSTFPLSSQPPPPPDTEDGDDDGGDGGDSTADPLTGGDPGSVIPNPGGGASTNNGPVIGSVVGLAAIAYVGVAMFVVRRQRNKKLREQEAAEEAKAKISAPVNVQDGTQGWGWHSS